MIEAADAVCGIDVGSQGACLSIFTADGERLATTNQEYDVVYPRPGWAEQDPGAWTAALTRGLQALGESVDLDRIVAISFASQLDGLVCVDEGGKALGPAIIWLDRRADPICREVAERFAPEAWYERSGCNLDGSHVAAKIAWVARNRTDENERAARYLLPGAFLLRHVSGADAIDPTNASSTMALDPDTSTWDEELLAAFEVD
ncbi:MAG: xylulokinase, partial [Gaiellaceae bacterium]